MPERIPLHVIREREFENDLRALIGSIRDADDFVEAAEFVLSRDPFTGQPTKHSPIWALPMPLIEGEQVELYYMFDETTLWLLSLALI